MKNIHRLVIAAGTAGLLLGASAATVAQASDAHPSPDSSCSASHMHRTFRYTSPVQHKHDLLQCQHYPDSTGPARWGQSGSHFWDIIGTF